MTSICHPGSIHQYPQHAEACLRPTMSYLLIMVLLWETKRLQKGERSDTCHSGRRTVRDKFELFFRLIASYPITRTFLRVEAFETLRHRLQFISLHPCLTMLLGRVENSSSYCSQNFS